jgi:hypothetical protein
MFTCYTVEFVRSFSGHIIRQQINIACTENYFDEGHIIPALSDTLAHYWWYILEYNLKKNIRCKHMAPTFSYMAELD